MTVEQRLTQARAELLRLTRDLQAARRDKEKILAEWTKERLVLRARLAEVRGRERMLQKLLHAYLGENQNSNGAAALSAETRAAAPRR